MTVDLMSLHNTFEGVPSAFVAARDGIDVVLRDRGFRRTTPEDTAEALLRGARASAELTKGEGSETQRLVETAEQDAIRVSTIVLAQLPPFRSTPLQALAALHAEAAADLPEGQRGRPKDAESAERLQRLAKLLVDSTPCPALVTAAVVHAEIAAGQPFASHNGIVARAAERLTMVARGIDPACVLVPEAAHLAQAAAYRRALDAYRAGGLLEGSGVHSWLLYAATAYAGSVVSSPLHANGTQTSSGAAAHT
jgi:hypothetical protein